MSDEIKEKVFDFAYTLAMRDATQRKAYYQKGKTIDKKRLFECKPARDAVKKYIDAIMDCNGSPDFETTEAKVEEEINKRLDDNNPVFTFGNAQKLINMTAKYMYIACYHNSDFRPRFEKCHCPMDCEMTETVAKQAECNHVDVSGLAEKHMAKDKDKKHKKWKPYLTQSWSKITKENRGQYDFFQELVEILGKQSSNPLFPIEYDFSYWGNAES